MCAVHLSQEYDEHECFPTNWTEERQRERKDKTRSTACILSILSRCVQEIEQYEDDWPSTWLIQNSLLSFSFRLATDAAVSLLFLNYKTNLRLLPFITRCLCYADRCQRAIVFLLFLHYRQRTRTRRLALGRTFSSCVRYENRITPCMMIYCSRERESWAIRWRRE